MKSYLLKLSGREEGPYSDSQIAQLFADQQVNRSTPCKPEANGEWKTIDDYLPMLKYGTQLPAPTKPPPWPLPFCNQVFLRPSSRRLFNASRSWTSICLSDR